MEQKQAISGKPESRVPDQESRPKHPNWGGRRPGAGAPKGNLNAFKHGRTSRRQAQLLETALDIPQVRQTLIDLAKRERRRRKQAEEGYGVLITHLLERVAKIVLENDQGQNNQEFLDFLNPQPPKCEIFSKNHQDAAASQSSE